jgi:hypothetical protein
MARPLVVASWLAIAMVTAVCPLLRLDRLLTAGDMKSSLAGFDVYPPAAIGTCVGCAPGDQVARWLSRKQSRGAARLRRSRSDGARHHRVPPGNSIVLLTCPFRLRSWCGDGWLTRCCSRSSVC